MAEKPLCIHIIDELKLGGAQTHLLSMLRVVAPLGVARHEVYSLFDHGALTEVVRDELGLPCEALHLDEYTARRDVLGALGKLTELFRSKRPYLVEAHLSFSRLLGLPAAWWAGVPRRVGFEQGDVFFNSWKWRVANFFGQAFAQDVVVCSEALGDWAHATHRTARSRLQVYHNSVDMNRFTPGGDGSFRRELGVGDDAFLICTVGTLGRGVNKRVDVSIDAIAKARERSDADLHLVVCGDGDQRELLEARAEANGVGDVVHFMGNRSDVPRILADADLFCHAAPWEPFGIVCVEAMACGLPVVVPNAGGMQEAVRHGVDGWIYPVEDVDALAGHLARLADDPAARAQAGRAALEGVERFDVRPYVERLYEMYGVPLQGKALATRATAG